MEPQPRESAILNELPTADLIALSNIISAFREKRSSVDKSMEDFADEYSIYVKNNFSEKYHQSVKSSFKHLLNYFDKDKVLNSTTLREVEQFLFHIKEQVPKGYLIYFRTIKAAMNQAVEWEYLDANPFNKIKLQKIQKNKPDFISPEELTTILNNIGNTNIRDIVTFAFYTGCRISEILCLKYKHINIEQNIITIGDENFSTKTRQQRVIPMCDKVIAVLNTRKIRGQENYIFCKTNGAVYSSNYVSRNFKQACRKANLSEKIHFHSLRHSYASYLAINGVPLNTIKELLGHSSITTTEIYSHTNLNSLKEATLKFNKIIETNNAYAI